MQRFVVLLSGCYIAITMFIFILCLGVVISRGVGCSSHDFIGTFLITSTRVAFSVTTKSSFVSFPEERFYLPALYGKLRKALVCSLVPRLLFL
jgi:hypothetical protein